ncbi:HDL193Wp [Eremothecium sinecaudum]|uniref:HDL193Wp n=1 Tax=Eremothecium sinecaudum TaxID=45286 RepID=A0A120K264_9SACH|nr:HDL193Wp [Eremothecium sinecaudum]AMD20551.1 HDL193Wp [Eremothecium sinecaudum]
MDVSQQLQQLEQVKRLAVANEPEKVLPKVLETALTLYRQNAARPRELARFCSQLFREILNSERIPSSEKPFLASQHLHDFVQMCQAPPAVDHVTYTNVLLAFGTSYECLFDLVAKTSNEALWKDMVYLKDLVQTNWKTCFPLDPTDALADHGRSLGAKLASVKLLSKLVIVHTQGTGVNIGAVPDNHPVIRNKAALQAESKRLLDVLISYLIDEPMMVAPLFSAILHCLAFVMKQRPMATLRILSGLLKFNVDMKYQQDHESALQYRLAKRFVERSYKNFVNFGLKSQLIKNSGSMAPYHSKLSKIAQTLHMIAEETKSKGILNFDPTQVERKMDARERERYHTAAAAAAASASSGNNGNGPLSKSPTPVETSISAPPLFPPPAGVFGANGSAAAAAVAPATASVAAAAAATAAASASVSDSANASVVPQPPAPGVQLDSFADLPALVRLQNYTMSKASVSNFFNNSPVAFDNNCSSIYSLMNSKHSDFDVSTLSQPMLVRLCTDAIYQTDTNRMIAGLSIVASRYTDLMNKAADKNPVGTVTSTMTTANNETESDIDNGDRRPSKRLKVEDASSMAETEDATANLDDDEEAREFTLAPPTPLSQEEKVKHLHLIVSNLLDVSASDEAPGIAPPTDVLPPLHRARLLHWENRTSWVVLLSRLSARGLQSNTDMSDVVRQRLYDYFLEDFSSRVAVVIDWLSEEWYAEMVQSLPPKIYNQWSLKVLDGLVPFLESSHRKIFIRLVSELPHLNGDHVSKLKSLCLDPLRSSLGFQALKFLVMFRPPVKPVVKDLLKEMINADESVKDQCESILAKFY